MKSARPSAIGWRRAGPTKNDTERIRPAAPGSANRAGPEVCR